MREIYVQQIMSRDSEDPKKAALMSLAAKSSNIERLELRRCRLNGAETQGLLGACKNLKTLVYDIGDESVSIWDEKFPDACAVSMTDLRDALTSTMHTLENLWIDLKDFWVGDTDDYRPIASLRTFARLKNLKVGMFVLFGISDSTIGHDPPGPEELEIVASDLPDLAAILPESLETLYIGCTEGRIGILSAALEILLQVKQTSNPRLTRIAIDVHLEGNVHAPSLKPVERVAMEADVELRILDPGSRTHARTREIGRGREDLITWACSMEEDAHGNDIFLIGLE
ncbi:MAG: hypothetical protein Q9183_006888 [Haloplaca sp. 2 TL-2023]